MSFTVLGSLAIPKKSFSTSGYTDFFDEEIDTGYLLKLGRRNTNRSFHK